jgi:hypothetical protein
VEGGACVPHNESEQRLWKTVTAANITDADAALTQSRACARAIVAALRDLKFARPDEIQGLL